MSQGWEKQRAWISIVRQRLSGVRLPQIVRFVVLIVFACIAWEMSHGGRKDAAVSVPDKAAIIHSADITGTPDSAMDSLGLLRNAYAVEHPDGSAPFAVNAERTRNANTRQDFVKPQRMSVDKSATPETETPSFEMTPKTVPLTTRIPVSVRPDPSRGLARFKEYMKTLRENNSFLQEKNELLNKLIAAKDMELVQVKKENASLQESLNNLLENHVRLKDEFDTNITKMNEQLKRKNSELTDINVVKYVRAGLQVQVGELTDKLAELSSKRSELEVKVTQLQQEKSFSDKALAVSKTELRKQLELNSTLNETIEDLKKELARRNDEVEKFQQPRYDLELENVKLKGEKEGLEKQIKDLTQRLDSTNSSKDDTKKSVLELTALVTKKELEKQLELREKNKVISRIQEELNKVRKENESLRVLFDRRGKTVQQFRSTKLEVLESQLDNLKKETEDYRKQAVETRELLKKERVGNKVLKQKVDSLMRAEADRIQ